MAENREQDLKQGLEQLEDADITEISDEEMEGVAGGAQQAIEGESDDCTSVWCCTSSD